MINKSKILALIISSTIIFSGSSFAKDMNIYDETVINLQNYLKIDTTNPPGNEMETAKFLKNILDKEGIENKIFDLGNNRANFYAILKGDGSKKPIVMLHHMDVVPANPEYWSIPPFSGKIVNDEIYGRGAIDIKGKGIIDLMTMINLKRTKLPLKRDIIFLAVADEEENSLGSKWMIQNKPELLKNAEYLFDEGSTIFEDKEGKILYGTVGIGEKSPLWLTLTFTGEPGHGSIPNENSSVNKAIKAANKILEYSKNFEFNVIEGIEESIALSYSGDITKLTGYKKDIKTSLKNKDFLNEIAKNPDVNALIRNTISITGLKGSDKINIIPNEASINLDCRLIPNIDKDTFINELKKVIDDETVKIKINEHYQAKYSPANTEYTKILEKVINKFQKGVKIMPTIITASTDSSLYRNLGINVYGFETYKLDNDILNTPHGNNERIKIRSVKFGIDYLTEILKELNK